MNESQYQTAMRLMAERLLLGGGANRDALPELIDKQVEMYSQMARGERAVTLGCTIEFPERKTHQP